MSTVQQPWRVLPHGPLVKVTENIWTVKGALPSGPPIGRRMVIVKCNSGKLLIHSAIALDEASMAEIEAWGSPDILIVPNGWHRLDAKAYTIRYPQLRVFCPEAAKARVNEVVTVDGVYGSLLVDPNVRVEPLVGVRAEGVFIVRSGEEITLIFSDSLFNLPHQTGLPGLILRLLGSTAGPRVTPICKLLLVQNKKALAQNLLRLSTEPGLSRILVAHGDIIDQNAPGVLTAVARSLHVGAKS